MSYLQAQKDILTRLEKDAANLAQSIEAMKKDVWKTWLKCNPDAKTLERFEAWLEFGPKKHHGSACDIVSRDGEELFSYDDPPMWPQRHQTFKIQDVADRLFDEISEGNKAYLDTCPYTEQDVLDWMEELIKCEFGTMVFDW